MNAPVRGGGRDARLAWACTLLALAPCLAYVLALSLVPARLAAPIARGTRVSVAMAAGLALVVLIVVVATVYTRHMNRGDAPPT